MEYEKHLWVVSVLLTVDSRQNALSLKNLGGILTGSSQLLRKGPPEELVFTI